MWLFVFVEVSVAWCGAGRIVSHPLSFPSPQFFGSIFLPPDLHSGTLSSTSVGTYHSTCLECLFFLFWTADLFHLHALRFYDSFSFPPPPELLEH